MRRVVCMLFLAWVSLGAAVVSEKQWKEGLSFSRYLKVHGIGADIFSSINKEDAKFLSDISVSYRFYELIDRNGTLLQALIPISKEMQIHLYKEKDTYRFDIIPIEYQTKTYFGRVVIEHNLHVDTKAQLGNPKLSDKLAYFLKDAVDTRRLRKGDTMEFLYRQATRMGKLHGDPEILVGKLRIGEKERWVYADEEGRGHTSTKSKQPYTVITKKKVTYRKKVKASAKQGRFIFPLRRVRITSHFSYRRWHPILRRYRPHHGTDFGARSGTPLRAVNDGTVTFAGWKGGYGKVVQIRHKGGYESLYAHQSRIRVRKGQRVKRGDIIGYVGSTGRSTGPHLHFGMKKNGRWIDPLKVLGKKSIPRFATKTYTRYENVKQTYYRTVTIKDAIERKKRLEKAIEEGKTPFVWQTDRLIRAPKGGLRG